MRKIITVIVLLAAGCGDAANGDAGAGGDDGTGGVAGFGGFAGEGGTGGVVSKVACGVDEDCDAGLVCTRVVSADDSFCEDVGTLAECETVTVEQSYVQNPDTGESVPYNVRTSTWEYVSTTPGELLEITVCDDYNITDGVPVPERTIIGCRTFEVEAPDDVLEQMCTHIIDSIGASSPPFYEDIGWVRVYVKRVEQD